MRYGIAAVCLALVVAGCQPKTEAPAPAAAPAVAAPAAAPAEAVPAPAPAEATAAPVVAEAAPAATPIGVAECDEYLRKYDECIASKVPAETRENVRVALEATRDAWKKAAETEQGKAGLAAACKEATEMAKTQTAAWGCGF